MTQPAAYGPARDATEAARRALARHGITVPDHAARSIAEAILSHAVDHITLVEVADRHAWDIPDCREDILHRLHHRLISALLSHGVLPTEMPTQTLTYFTWSPSPVIPPGTQGSESPDWDWGQVQIKLSVPVRIPIPKPTPAGDPT
jgi:hypothetical protein